MSTDTGKGKAQAAQPVVISISFAPSSGVFAITMPPNITPVLLYGMLELAKDEVRRRHVDALERQQKLVHLAPGALPRQ